jgi:hypothetical protein
MRQWSAPRQKRSFLAQLVIGFALWIGFPTAAAYQDMTSLVSGLEAGAPRWNAVVERSVAGSVHQAEMPFSDGDLKTGSISGAGVAIPGIGEVAFRAKAGAEAATPDEARINRTEKRGRIVKIAPVAPPRSFTAGSVFERTSSLLQPSLKQEVEMAFEEPALDGKEIQIAQEFYMHRPDEPDPGVPV